tara:strand:- start:4561 stop:6330 length:1770 start_codon:yes stop_codon:yes gene_type:complete
VIFSLTKDSKIKVEWKEKDALSISSFFATNLPLVQIDNNEAKISYADFRHNFKNFRALDKILHDKASFSEQLKDLLNSTPKYSDEIKKKLEISDVEIQEKIETKGFIRKLLPHQLKNVKLMISLSASANFSVPGAGKTTDALATYAFKRNTNQDKVLIICPKSAFTAWEEEILECFNNESYIYFTDIKSVKLGIDANANFRIINYEKYRTDLLIQKLINEEVLDPRKNYTVIVDESHKLSGESTNQAVSQLSIVKNKIILSGTPLPHSIEKNLVNQFNFLYPDEEANNLLEKFQPIFRRTSKNDLKLPKPNIEKIPLQMSGAQLELNRRMIKRINNFDLDFEHREKINEFKQIIMRYLQFCSNPHLQYEYIKELSPKLGEQIMNDGHGVKFDTVVQRAKEIALSGKKVIIWSTFPRNLETLKLKLAPFSPAVVHGRIPIGSSSKERGTRRYAIYQFKNNPECRIFLANPATAGEGISLHKICEHALYLDRSYNGAHFFQSKDRIHRIGISEEARIKIEIFLYENSIDKLIDENLDGKERRMLKFLEDSSIVKNDVSLDLNFEELDEKDENLHINDSEIENIKSSMQNLE